MIVGLLQIDLFLQGCTSLKEKRQVVKSIIRKVQSKYNVSVSEVDYQDLWQRATVGIACVTETGLEAEKTFRNIEAFVEKLNKAQIIDSQFTVFQPE